MGELERISDEPPPWIISPPHIPPHPCSLPSSQEVKDLLRDGAAAPHSHHRPQQPPSGGGGGAPALGSAKGLKVQDDPGSLRGVHVEGLVEEGLRSAEHLEELLAAVEARRHVSEGKGGISPEILRTMVAQLHVRSQGRTLPHSLTYVRPPSALHSAGERHPHEPGQQPVAPGGENLRGEPTGTLGRSRWEELRVEGGREGGSSWRAGRHAGEEQVGGRGEGRGDGGPAGTLGSCRWEEWQGDGERSRGAK